MIPLAAHPDETLESLAVPRAADANKLDSREPSRCSSPDHAEALAVSSDNVTSGGFTQRLAAAVNNATLRNGTLSLVDQAAVSGASFLTSVIIGRLCSKAELGVFYLAMTIVYLARGVQEQLVSAPYAIYCHRRAPGALPLYAGSSLLHFAGLSGLFAVGLLGFLGLLAVGIGPAGVESTVWVLVGVLPLLMLREFIRRLACAHLEMTTATLIDVAVAVLQLGGLLVLATVHRLNATTAFTVMAGACAAACAGWFLAKRRPLEFHVDAAIGDWRQNWDFARWALASHLVGFVVPTLMPWVVTFVRGSAEAGAFAACVGIVGTASMFMTGLATYLIPKGARAFASGGVPELRRVLRAAALIYGAVLGAFALFAVVTGDFLLVLAFGGKYAGYGSVVAILALSMLVLSMGLTAGIGLWAIDRPKANLRADLCSLIVTLAMLFCLLQPMGLLGAALSDLGGKIVGAVVRYETLRRLLNSPECQGAIAAP